MPLWSPFKPAPHKAAADALHQGLVRAARRPAFFGPGRIPDTFGGRLEALTIHAAVLLDRLSAEPGADALGQAVTDRMFRGLDDAVREVGVGDLSVGKAMKKLATQIYGRFEAYHGPLRAGDEAALALALLRNVFGAEEAAAAAFCAHVACYMVAARAAMANTPTEALADPAAWPPFVTE